MVDENLYIYNTYTVVNSSPLKIYIRSRKEHILVILVICTFVKKTLSREVVFNIADANIKLLFVSLNKCEKQFSASTMYHDHAISSTLCHWQTQNSTRLNSGLGLRNPENFPLISGYTR
jgi:hypothetical protein